MKRKLKNAVVVITGSSAGIGRQVARMLGSCGAKLVLNGRNTEKLRTVTDECIKQGFSAVSCASDVSTPDGAKKLIAAAIESYGRIDILINNVGISSRGLFKDLTPKVAEESLRVNVLGYVYPTHVALPHLIESKGYVLFISTISAICGFPGVSMYSASKMAITSITQSLYCEYYKKNLRCGIIYLPSVENDPDKVLLTSDGREITYTRNFSLTQREVGKRIIQTIERSRRRTILTAKGKFTWAVQHYLPRLADWILRRSQGKFHSIK